jgi:hypothetical protein
MNSLFLSENWDLAIDSLGNVAVCSEPYRLAQDAACAIKTFGGEVYYNTTLGIPYFQNILGHLPTLAYVKSQMADAAETVPGVVSARVFITSFDNRVLRGQVQVTDSAGNVTAASF